MPLLTFDAVCKDFGQLSSGVKSVSFQVEAGEFTALAGPSGSGKTTILNLAAGLDRPSGGKIVLLEKEISGMTAEAVSRFRREKVGFVFQAYNLFPVLTALENVEYPLALKKVPEKKRRKLARQALEEVGLEKELHKRPNQLSGGQQQRVAVARAIVSKPSIIFADEPTANLDSASTDRLLKLFRELNTKYQITFLFSSHDARVLSVARRIIHVKDGAIENEGNHFTEAKAA